jgi:hypothetical protein
MKYQNDFPTTSRTIRRYFDMQFYLIWAVGCMIGPPIGQVGFRQLFQTRSHRKSLHKIGVWGLFALNLCLFSAPYIDDPILVRSVWLGIFFLLPPLIGCFCTFVVFLWFTNDESGSTQVRLSIWEGIVPVVLVSTIIFSILIGEVRVDLRVKSRMQPFIEAAETYKNQYGKWPKSIDIIAPSWYLKEIQSSQNLKSGRTIISPERQISQWRKIGGINYFDYNSETKIFLRLGMSDFLYSAIGDTWKYNLRSHQWQHERWQDQWH